MPSALHTPPRACSLPPLPCIAYCLCSRVGSVAVAVPAPPILCFAPLSIVTACWYCCFMRTQPNAISCMRFTSVSNWVFIMVPPRYSGNPVFRMRVLQRDAVVLRMRLFHTLVTNQRSVEYAVHGCSCSSGAHTSPLFCTSQHIRVHSSPLMVSLFSKNHGQANN